MLTFQNLRLQADTPPGLAESYSQMLVVLGIAVGSDDDKRAMERGRDWLAHSGTAFPDQFFEALLTLYRTPMASHL